MATGGFSTRNASIAAYNSPYVEYVVIVFMFLAGANFNLHYWALRGKVTVYQDSEFRFYAGVTLLAMGIIMFARWVSGALWSESMIRSSLFQTVSIVTTTGFITDDYEKWPLLARLILLLLMFIGGCTASTGGAIKNVRVYVLFKYLLSELKKVFHPHGIFPVKVRNKSLTESTVSNIVSFIILYILLFVLGVLCMAGMGLDLDTSIGSVAATLGNVGPGLGTVGAVDNYSAVPILGKWVLSFMMLAGRLEIFTILVLFIPRFWR
jgi:trk system potassium uptake protein TrkH